MLTDSVHVTFSTITVRTMEKYRKLGTDAIAQLPRDEDLHAQIDPGSNSIAVIVKHVAGNLRSRFTDFLTTDGEKPDRDRDGEFEMNAPMSRSEILKRWDEGFAVAKAATEVLTEEDLNRTVYIRGEAHSVVEALTRSLTHTSYHVGQIVYLARHAAGPAWRTLSTPKRKTSQ